ncbi:MAG: chorismate-binding protein, partial [Ilumatobacteraceae bacterium]|nr:chorismate-binding protein [Ilumatobacteraceae bacterium]
MRPSRHEFHALAAQHTVVPVWAEVLGDLETPVAAYLKLVGDGDGFLLESVEHAERWARYSFVGHDPVATLELRDGLIEIKGQHLSADIPLDQGMLAALDAIIAAYRAPIIPDLPPLQGGVMGYLGYDTIREVEHLPHVPHDDRGFPDAVMSIIGSLAAFDHWRQRVYLIESVPVLDMNTEAIDREYDEACVRVQRAVDKLSQPLSSPAAEPPQLGEAAPEVRSSMADGVYQQAVEVAKEHILAGDIFQVVLAQRYDIDLQADPFDFYRVLRQVNP